MGARCFLGCTVTLFFVCCGLLIGLGCTIVRDYLQTSYYKETKCTVLRSKYENDELQYWPNCNFDCEKIYDKDGVQSDCLLSQFPCLQITANHNYDDQLVETILHASPEQARKYPQCSIDACKQDSKQNDYIVKRWEKKYGQPGMTHVCYYNERDVKELVLDVPSTAASATHALVWPSIGIFLSIVFFIIILIRMYQQRGEVYSTRETGANQLKKRLPKSPQKKKDGPIESAI